MIGDSVYDDPIGTVGCTCEGDNRLRCCGAGIKADLGLDQGSGKSVARSIGVSKVRAQIRYTIHVSGGIIGSIADDGFKDSGTSIKKVWTRLPAVNPNIDGKTLCRRITLQLVWIKGDRIGSVGLCFRLLGD